MGGDLAQKLRPETCKFRPTAVGLAKSWQCQVHSLRPDLTCSNGHYFRRRWSIQHVDEAELAAGRVQVVEASILWHNEVDIEVDVEAGEGPAVARCGVESAGSFRASSRPLWHVLQRPA